MGIRRFLAVEFLKIYTLKIYATLSKSVSYEGSGPFTCPLHNPHRIPMRSAVLVPVINLVA